jgi:ABC-type sugar transport system ATPase subunit
MSFSRFAVERSGDGLVLRRDGYELAIGEIDAELPQEVLAGVRPEDALLWTTGADLLGPISGEIEYVEDLGREWFAGVATDAGPSFVIGGASKPIPEIGEKVRFGIRPSGLYLFDPASEVCVFHPERKATQPPPFMASVESV